MNIITTSNPEYMCNELLPAGYTIDTRRNWGVGATTLAEEGKCSVEKHAGYTDLHEHYKFLNFLVRFRRLNPKPSNSSWTLDELEHIANGRYNHFEN